MNPYTRKISATNMFLLPIVGIGRENLFKAGFIEAFYKDELGEMGYEDCIYLLFRPKKWEEFNLFTEDHREKGNIIDEYHYGDGWTVIVYKFPTKFKKDVEIIMTGKFSHVSESFKKAVPRHYKIAKGGEMVEELTYQHMVFDKDERLREYWKEELGLDLQNDDEFWHFYKEREVLNEASLKRLEI